MDEGSRKAPLITFLAVLVVLGYFVAKIVAPFLISLIMGGILALVAQPAYRALARRNYRPTMASGLVTALVFLTIATPILVIASLAIKQGLLVGKGLIDSSISFGGILDHLMSLPILRSFDTGELQLSQRFNELALTGAKYASAFVLKMAESIPFTALQLVLASVSCFYFLLDGRRFMNWLYKLFPIEEDVRLTVIGAFRETSISIVWASMATAGTQSLVMILAYVVLGVPAAFLAGGATFIFSWIPMLGHTPALLVGVIYLLVQGAWIKAVMMIGFGLTATLIENLMRPLILKGEGEIHPLVGLVAIFGGIQLFGLFGVLLGPIIAAMFIAALQIWPIVGKRYGIKFGGSAKGMT